MLLKFVKHFILNFDNFLDVFGSFKQLPLVCEFESCQFDIKLLQNAVHLHAVVDLALQLLNLNSNFTDELLGFSQLVNIGRSFVDFSSDFLKLRCDLVGLVFGLLVNQLDFLFDNLLELACVEVADVFTVDLEHAYVNRLRDQLLDQLFLLHVLINVCSQFCRASWVLN